MNPVNTLFARLAGFAAVLTLPLCAANAPAESFDAALVKTAQTYTERIRTATDELAAARAEVMRQKAPLLTRWGELEAKVLKLETEISRMRISKEEDKERRRQSSKEGDLLRKNLAYLNTLGSDGIKMLEASQRPADPDTLSAQISELQRNVEAGATSGDGRAALAVAETGAQRLAECRDATLLPGKALLEGDSRILPGKFLQVGPECLFLSDDGTVAGTVRLREGAPVPVVHRIESWTAADATSLFRTGSGLAAVDPTQGKALKLAQTSGTFSEHVHRGGIVAYSILVVGAISLLLMALKFRDLARFQVDASGRLHSILELLGAGNAAEARKLAASLRPSTRELVLLALDNKTLAKEQLEEVLDAHLTSLRLHAERRLPLLAVIATASPLMGLLGTVMGMVKTFALITVFGTGNASKLSSGISEVLVTTELGLAVAIPSLVAHGFLSHRIHKHLSLLERQAYELTLALHSPEKGQAIATTPTLHLPGAKPVSTLA